MSGPPAVSPPDLMRPYTSVRRDPKWRGMDKHAQAGWFNKLVSRRSVLAGSAAGLTVPAIALGAAAPSSGAAATGETKKITIYAEALPGGLFGYGLAPGQASVPGPILEMYEGD